MKRTDNQPPIADETASLAKIVDNLELRWRESIETQNIIFTCFIAPELSDIFPQSSTDVANAINGLLSNAQQFTQAGRIHIHATSEPNPAEPSAVDVSIIIADTGRGIRGDVEMQAFYESSRLGEIRNWARQQKGDISVTSREGRGSEFTLRFKVSPNIISTVQTALENLSSDDDYIEIDLMLEADTLHYSPQAPSRISARNLTPPIEPIRDEANSQNIAGSRILIVEDIPSNQDVIKIFLEPEGCECLCANGGEEALSILETQPVDFILMDIRMPGMNGIETTLAIRNSRASYANIPIIALTADTAAETNAACMAAGTDIFLTKPILCRKLIEAIQFLKQIHVSESDIRPAKTA